MFFIILSVIVFELFIVFFIIHTDSVKSDTVNNCDAENLFYNYQDTSASDSIDITPTASCSETSGQKYDDIYIKDCYENRIALTFDDGPGGACTERLLDGLRKRNVKALSVKMRLNILILLSVCMKKDILLAIIHFHISS